MAETGVITSYSIHYTKLYDIFTPADVWLKIARKELNGAFALMTGKYKARGQIGLLLKMDSLFSQKPTEAELVEKS